jgi:TolB-like protein/Tfp pilus assembly protein PilF
MADQPIISSAEEPPRRTRLESWKAVAAHFGRDVTTVRRWERREGLPIHRLFHEKLGSIYAYSDELDAWWAARRLRDTAGDAEPVSVTVDPPAGSACVEETRPRQARATAREAIGWASAIAALSLLLTAAPVTSRVATWLDDARGLDPGAATGAAIGIAVLPLTNGSGTAHDLHFSDGMTTALTTELAAVESLKVIAPTSMRRYRNRGGDSVVAIAHELDVDWMLEGSAQLNPGEGGTGPRVRIAVSLTRAATGQRLWAKQYDRPMEDVLALQSEVARAVVAQILGPRVPLRAPRRARPRAPADMRGYELYLRGEFHTEQLNPVALARGVGYLTQAVAHDPGFAPAWAGLAKANLLQESWGDARAGDRASAVRQATLKALALDPDLAEAHDVLGRVFLIYDRDWVAAEGAFRKAIARGPSLAVAYNGYSILLQTLLRTEESLVAAARVIELDPMTAWAWAEEGRALYRARRYADAEQRYVRALALDPAFAPAADRLVQLFIVQRRFAEARTMLSRLERLPSSRGVIGLRAWLDAASGDVAAARQSTDAGRHAFRRYIALGEHDAALGALERAADDGSLQGFTLGNPELDPLRRDPRFARLAARLGLPVERLVALGTD